MKNCELPEIDKLRIEMYLIRIKRILLEDRVEARVRLTSNIEKEFKEVYDQICNLCSQNGCIADAEGIIIRMQNLVEDVKRLSNVTD